MKTLFKEVVDAETPLVASALRKATNEGGGVSPVVVAYFQRMDQTLASAPEHLACVNGCSYCCHYHIYVHPIEVFALADLIKKLNLQTQAVIKNRLASNVRQTSMLTVVNFRR